MSAGNHYENVALDLMLGASHATAYPDILEMALFLDGDGEATIGTEPTIDQGYERLLITNDGTNFPAASGGQKTNLVTIEFAPATISWGNLVRWAFLDELERMVISGPMNMTVLREDAPYWAPGALIIQAD